MTTRPGKSWWKWCNRRARKPNDEIWHTSDTPEWGEPDPQKQTAIVVELNRILQNQSKKAKAARVNRLPRQRSA